MISLLLFITSIGSAQGNPAVIGQAMNSLNTAAGRIADDTGVDISPFFNPLNMLTEIIGCATTGRPFCHRPRQGATANNQGGSSTANSPTGQAWIHCANEWETCAPEGPGPFTVAYGHIDGSWVHRNNVTGDIECSNSVFGDPAYGTVKACIYMREIPVGSLVQIVQADSRRTNPVQVGTVGIVTDGPHRNNGPMPVYQVVTQGRANGDNFPAQSLHLLQTPGTMGAGADTFDEYNGSFCRENDGSLNGVNRGRDMGRKTPALCMADCNATDGCTAFDLNWTTGKCYIHLNSDVAGTKLRPYGQATCWVKRGTPVTTGTHACPDFSF